MNVLVSLAAVLGPAFIAWLLLRQRVQAASASDRVALAGVALAFGIGCTSSAFFLWRLSGMPLRLYPWIDLVLQGAILASAIYTWRHRHRTPRVPNGQPKAWRPASILVAAGVVFVAAALFFRFTSQLPHGEWDAWAIWNLRAAFLSVPDAHWRDGFTPLLKWSHPDYPLLLPSSVARLWIFGEHGSVSGPRLLAAAFVSSSALVMAGSVARRAGTAAMSLALALLLVPTYIYWASSQTADVAIGSYVLIAAASLSAVSLPGRYVVAGLAAGFAVWTKNEGLVAAAAIAVSALIGMGTPGGPRRELLRFATAFAVAAVPLLLFKITLSPASDLLTQIVHDDPLGKVTQATRHLFVAGHLVRELSQWGGLTPVPATALLLPCVVLAARRGRQFPRDAAQGATIVGLMLVVYYFMYVLSPYDLEWHIRTSAPRLIAQVWPVIVWSCVIAWLAPASSSGRTSDGALPSRPTTS